MTRRSDKPAKDDARNSEWTEDAALWDWAMREVVRPSLKQRLRSGMARPHRAHGGGEKPSAELFTGGHGRVLPEWEPPAPRPATEPRKPPELAEFDRRKARKIARGGQDIDARIDLHGLRLSEAQDVLTGFLTRCYMNGCRTVLVITGKGRTERDPYYEPFDLFANPDRGVLKSNVPRWLAEPELRAMVASYTSAAQKHGGEGALYVQLRSANRE
jgi:DNA-nicking Smr family endonuclease